MSEEYPTRFAIQGQRFNAPPLEPALYVAATPIGNLKDITLRVLEVLAASDIIACEDTRVTSKLLRHYGIQGQTMIYNEHNAQIAGERILDEIAGGKSVALVSDAGMPLLSDPGSRLVRDAREKGISVIPLPGASAPLTALVASGLPMADWRFLGFLPSRQGARMKAFEAVSKAPSTLVFFESPNRIMATLQDMQSVFGHDRLACIARELTKLHEEVITAPIGELAETFRPEKCRGEFVILIEPAHKTQEVDTAALLLELLQTESVSRAAAQAAELTGLPKRDLYQQALGLNDRQNDQ